MSETDILNKIINSIANLDIQNVPKLCEEALNKGILPTKIITNGLVKGLAIVGEKFEAKEYFIPELIVVGESVKRAMKILEPHMKKTDIIKIGKVIVGTVHGDLHDIGKNLLKIYLEADGFEVIDLGNDAPKEKFVEIIRAEKPFIVGMSALTTFTMPEMEKVIEALKEAGLRNQVKIIIGGAPITKKFADMIGADDYAKDVIEGVKICKRWMDEI
ncbi:MAG: corrinoid protein [Candidatus Helarchaeota archaeon]|nr:corrinoid protein [Candidatus Helarchaeota archaeon]